MSYDELDPRQAHERLVATEDALFLDVRSVPEFEQGHPEGAWNLPLLHLTRAGMEPNADFLSVAEAVLPRDHLLVVGCKAGGRSAKACGLLASVGFSRLVNVAGGFAGAHDPMTGRLLLEGWAACGLPTSTAPMPGRTWAELRARLA
jgi:rhodanese-related sulfurtransferase